MALTMPPLADHGLLLPGEPLLHTTFRVEHKLLGDATLGYHLVNILLQVVAALIAALILRRLAAARWP